MNVASMLMAASTAAPKKRKAPPPITKEAYLRSRATLSARSDARWKALFGDGEYTTGQLAAKRGGTHMGVLSSLYKLEKRGKIKRTGLAPTNGNKPTVLWRWVNTEE